MDLSALPREEDTETADRRRRMIESEGACSEIESFLFVGGNKVASDRELLRKHGITHIVNSASSDCEDYHISDPALTYFSFSLSG